MCILKNPNSDVKDKEVPEHRFCECPEFAETYPKFEKCREHHGTDRIAVGQYRFTFPDYQAKYLGFKTIDIWLCDLCGGPANEDCRIQ